MVFALETAAESHLALPLVFGSGEFRGFYVIRTIATISRALSGTGAPIAITLRVRLQEWAASPDPNASPIPSFTPLGLVGAGSSAPAAVSGVSALLALPAPSGAFTPNLHPDDVPASVITRSREG